MVLHKEAGYKAPSYPDKPAVRQNPDILYTLPLRWKRNAAAATAALATLSLLASACEAEPPEPTAATVTALPSERPTLFKTNIPSPAPSPSPTPHLAQAVPLFEHGYGRGGFGCVSVSPPVFLSESEALDVIREVAEQAGIDFTETVSIKTRIPALRQEKWEYYPDEANSTDGIIELDGYCSEKQIAFEFISTSDIDAWRIDTANGTFSTYPLIDTAKALAANLAAADKTMTVAVFYDPVANDSELAKVNKQLTKGNKIKSLNELAKEDLRAQVLDFIAWLKAQGIV